MEKDKIIDKMKEIKNRRELEIFLSENEIDENVLEKHKVLNVKYLGNILMDNNNNLNNEKEIYLVIEQMIDENGNIYEVEKYYTEDFIFLGGNNKKDEYDFIMLDKEHINDKKLLKNLNELDKEGKLDLLQIEKTELIEIAKAIGISEEDIKSMSEIDLVKEIEENKEDSKKQKETENNEQEEKQLNEEQSKRITDGKQEIKLKTKVDDKKTLGKVLELDESEFTKVVVVYSEKLKQIQDPGENINNTLYSFVAIRKDGTAQVINDRLKVDERTGNDSYRESIKIDSDETARKDDKTKTRFQIIGKNGSKDGKSDSEKETLSLERGKYNEIKAYYGKGRSRYGQENVETQLETASIRPTSIELRKLQKDTKGIYNTDKMAKEANIYLDNHSQEKVSMYNVDGDEYTVGDSIDIFIDNNIDEWAKVVMDDTDVQIVFTNDEVKEMIKNYWLNNYGENAKNDDGKISKEEVESVENAAKIVFEELT